MPKVTEHPGVNVKQPKKVGYPFQLRWMHPLRNGQQVSPSIETRDGSVARSQAKLLSRLLRTPSDWKKKPDYVGELLWQVWQGDAIEQALTDAVQQVAFSASAAAALLPIVANPRNASAVPDIMDRYAPSVAEARKEAEQARREAEKLTNENKTLRDDNAILRSQLDTLKALLRKTGRDAVEEYAAKLFSEALLSFMGAKETLTEKQRTFHGWLSRFGSPGCGASRTGLNGETGGTRRTGTCKMCFPCTAPRDYLRRLPRASAWRPVMQLA